MRRAGGAVVTMSLHRNGSAARLDNLERMQERVLDGIEAIRFDVGDMRQSTEHRLTALEERIKNSGDSKNSDGKRLTAIATIVATAISAAVNAVMGLSRGG